MNVFPKFKILNLTTDRFKRKKKKNLCKLPNYELGKFEIFVTEIPSKMSGFKASRF